MTFNRKNFFDGVKERIDPTLNQEQVDGFEFLLASFENDARWNSVQLIAYGLATIWHETACSMQPVEEGYYLGKKTKVFQKKLRYYPYFGRGYVQLTWKANYIKAGKALGIDLIANPELALQPDIAFKILTEGLFQGWYGGKIKTYINANKTDYANARRCVNILDKAGLIAGYAKSFEKVLKASIVSAAEPAGGKPDSLTENTPVVHPPGDGDNTLSAEQPPTVIEQKAENIINAGDMSAAPAPEDKTMDAPPKDGATATSTKMTIAGIVVPGCIVAAIKTIQDLVTDGYVSASDIGSTVLSFIRDNQKYVFLLIGLLILLLIVKKLVKQVTFWLSMLTHAIPGWNNVKVVPTETPTPQTTLFGLLKK